MDYHDPGAHHFNLWKDVGRNEYGSAISEVFNELAHLPDLVGIEPDGGLVKDEEFGIVNQSVGKAHSLSLAFGEGANEGAFFFAQVAHFQNIADAFFDLGGFNTFEACSVAQVFVNPHIVVEGGAFGEVADVATGLDGLVKNIKTCDRGSSRRGGEISCEHPHGGAFSSAVWAKETDDLAALNLEGNFAHGCESGVAFGEVYDVDHGKEEVFAENLGGGHRIIFARDGGEGAFRESATMPVRWTFIEAAEGSREGMLKLK